MDQTFVPLDDVPIWLGYEDEGQKRILAIDITREVLIALARWQVELYKFGFGSYVFPVCRPAL